MRAIGNYLVVETMLDRVRRTQGGLELNEKVREDIRYKKAKILSVGSSIELEGLEHGTIITYDKAGAHPIEIGDETFDVIQLRDVVAILG